MHATAVAVYDIMHAVAAAAAVYDVIQCRTKYTTYVYAVAECTCMRWCLNASTPIYIMRTPPT